MSAQKGFIFSLQFCDFLIPALHDQQPKTRIKNALWRIIKHIYIYIYIKLINYVKSMVRKENTCASRSVLFSSGLKQECWYRSRVLVILPREGIREKVLSFEPIIATWFKAIYQTHLREQWRYEANKVALAITSCDELRYKHFIYIYSKK